MGKAKISLIMMKWVPAIYRHLGLLLGILSSKEKTAEVMSTEAFELMALQTTCRFEVRGSFPMAAIA